MAKNISVKALGPDDFPKTLDIDAKDLPEIKKWKIDEEHVIDVKVKVKSLSKSVYSGSDILRATLQIQKVAADNDEEDDLTKGMDSVPVTHVRK